MKLDKFFSIFSEDIAIDLGTANVIVCMRNKGIVINEPTIIAIEFDKNKKRKILAFGHQAKQMQGKTPVNIKVIEPMKDGVISDFEVVEMIIKHILKRVNRGFIVKPRILIAIPYGVTPVERNAFKDCVINAGARAVILVEETMAAAIGAGISVGSPEGSMIVDIGAGTTEVAVISLGGLVVCKSSRVAGDRLDEAIVNYLKQNFHIHIGKNNAQNVKVKIATATTSDDENLKLDVKGWSSTKGCLTTIEISGENIKDAIKELLKEIVLVIKSALEVVPPDLASDIVDNGIILTGGGSLIRNLDLYISKEVNLPVKVAENPLLSVASGASKVIEDSKLIKLIYARR